MNSYPPDSDLSIFRTTGPRRTINTVLSEIVCFDPETVDVHNSTMPSGLKTGIKLLFKLCSNKYKRFHINNSM